MVGPKTLFIMGNLDHLQGHDLVAFKVRLSRSWNLVGTITPAQFTIQATFKFPLDMYHGWAGLDMNHIHYRWPWPSSSMSWPRSLRFWPCWEGMPHFGDNKMAWSVTISILTQGLLQVLIRNYHTDCGFAIPKWWAIWAFFSHPKCSTNKS